MTTAPLMLPVMEAPLANVDGRWTRSLAKICRAPFRIFLLAAGAHAADAHRFGDVCFLMSDPVRRHPPQTFSSSKGQSSAELCPNRLWNALRQQSDPAIWTIATGEPAQIDLLTQSFAVYVQPEGGPISHGLATALIGPDGSVVKIWRGNGWQPSEVIDELRKL